MKRLQPLLVIAPDVLQLLQRVFLLLQRFHVQLLTLHLREELVHGLRTTHVHTYAKLRSATQMNTRVKDLIVLVHIFLKTK